MFNIIVRRRRVAITAGILLGVAASCSDLVRPNQGHCEVREGDAFCADKYGDERRFCARGTAECELDAEDGCVAARPVDDACYSPCGGGTSIVEDAECEGIAETGTDATTLTTSLSDTTPTDTTDDPTVNSMSMSASETETQVTSETDPTTGPVGCMSSEECTDAANPICVDEACVPCTSDDECLEKDPGTPACRDDGQCVACTSSNASACEGTTPVCDEGTSACVGCTYHEQCAVGACEMETGACFTDVCVTEVDGDDGDTIGEALGDGCVIVLHAGASAYDENVVLGAGDVVAIVAAPGEVPVIIGNGANANPTIDVSGGAVLYLQGVEVSGNGGVGVRASGGDVWLDRSRVVDNSGGGLMVEGGAYAGVRNCFVGGNTDDVVALDVTDSDADVLYSTLLTGIEFEDVATLQCTGVTDVTVRNSIVAMVGSVEPEIDCIGADVTYTATESGFAGTGNVMVSSVMPAWFVNLTSDFHLTTPPAAILTAAQWNAGDPLVDIDGDLRPTEDGTADVAGADVP